MIASLCIISYAFVHPNLTATHSAICQNTQSGRDNIQLASRARPFGPRSLRSKKVGKKHLPFPLKERHDLDDNFFPVPPCYDIFSWVAD